MIGGAWLALAKVTGFFWGPILRLAGACKGNRNFRIAVGEPPWGPDLYGYVPKSFFGGNIFI
jgi:hypothetical protein